MICFYCGKELVEEDKRQMVGLDVPYLNIWFHKPFCWSEANSPDLNTYLASKIEMIYNELSKENKRKK